MKTRKITIKIPKEKEKWMFSFGRGGSPKKRNAASFVYNAIEKHILSVLLRTNAKEKLAIVIKVGNDVVNESCASQNPYYLLFCLACFLEDHLDKTFSAGKIKEYKERGQEP